MPSYPVSVRRCHYIKANGTQCGSPALRDEKYCHFHMQWSLQNREINMNFNVRGTITLPTLEDANSIQVGLAEVMRLLVTNQIDHRTAALLLHALRTASVNIRHASFEPEPTLVVIDSECVERRPLGATAWSRVVGREYDEVENEVENDEVEKDELKKKDGEGDAPLRRMIEGVARNPKFLDERPGSLGGNQENESVEN
jgi:hypothetical protein